MVRQQIRVYGEVQGVGFRYRAFNAARNLELTGFVRNEADGSVAMEVQGEPRNIDMLLQLVGEGHYISITDIDRKEIPLVEERSFIISDFY